MKLLRLEKRKKSKGCLVFVLFFFSKEHATINKAIGAFLRILLVAIVAVCKRQACLVIVREWLKNMSHTVEPCDLVEGGLLKGNLWKNWRETQFFKVSQRLMSTLS